MATRIGCDNLVYTLLDTDIATAEPTYGAIKSAPGVMSISINPNASMETLFYDDGPGESASTLGMIEVEISKNELTAAQKADLLGHLMDSKGGVIYGANDTPPWVAVGFRTLKSNGKYRYIWMYKGKFMEPDDEYETKGDNINFQSDTISGQFVKLNSKFEIDGNDVYPWKYEIDEETAGYDSTVISSWFTGVKFPDGVYADATLSSILVDGDALEGFDPATEDYTMELVSGTTETPTVTAETNDASATAVVTPATDVTSVTEADRTTTIEVTAADGTTTKTYSIVFDVAA